MPLKKIKTVDSITAKLRDTVAELHAHAEDQLQKAEFQRRVADSATRAHEDHMTERVRAQAIASNIGALLETD